MIRYQSVDTKATRQLFAVIVIVFVVTLASCATPIPTLTMPMATTTPRIGGRVFGVECQPTELNMLHGEIQQFGLLDVGGAGKVTDYSIGTVVGDGGIEVSQIPAGNASGWSTLPGTVQVKSIAVDGPPRIVTYYINILVGGKQGTEHITGGNIWCQVNVRHTVPPITADTSKPSLPADTSKPSLPAEHLVPLECQPSPLIILHGDAAEIRLVAVESESAWTVFRIGDIVGTAGDTYAVEIEVSDPNLNLAGNPMGWSNLPGPIQIKSIAVDGPPRIESYSIHIQYGGYIGGRIVRANIICTIQVQHDVALTSTVTPTPIPPPTPKLPFITTEDGFRIQYMGPLQVYTGGKLAATFKIVTPDGKPARGTLLASLGDPPSDPRATHASGNLDAEGKVTLLFDINWPVGTTKLNVSHGGKVYLVVEIEVNPR